MACEPWLSVRSATQRRASLPYDFDKARDARGQIRMSALLAEVIRQPQAHCLRFFAWRAIAGWRRGIWLMFLDRYLLLLSARLDLSQSEMVAAT